MSEWAIYSTTGDDYLSLFLTNSRAKIKDELWKAIWSNPGNPDKYIVLLHKPIFRRWRVVEMYVNGKWL